MLKKSALMSVLLSLLVSCIHAVRFPEGAELSRYSELEKFAKRHRCSSQDESSKGQHHVKYEIERIINADRLKQVIDQERLGSIDIQINHK